MRGCYCLIINLEKNEEIPIGKLGEIDFKKGYYVYVGSAMNSLESRINRHFKKDKKLHWHVDYLLANQNCELVDAIYNISSKKVECELSREISNNNGVDGFGCSDCDCNSHLYYFKNKKEAIECVLRAYDSIAMECEFFKK
ncbi:GIY-YIG nuclease family protein [Methanobrevibacter sp.]|uniref:GIY-YIG nuclease family protein n=1 Tax=Methanobrevibacter sp. TaxID=66852 RepID=UPI00388D0CA4